MQEMNDFEKLERDLREMKKVPDFSMDRKKLMKAKLFDEIGIDGGLIEDVAKVSRSTVLDASAKARIKEDVFAKIETASVGGFWSVLKPVFSGVLVLAIFAGGYFVTMDGKLNDASVSPMVAVVSGETEVPKEVQEEEDEEKKDEDQRLIASVDVKENTANDNLKSLVVESDVVYLDPKDEVENDFVYVEESATNYYEEEEEVESPRMVAAVVADSRPVPKPVEDSADVVSDDVVSENEITDNKVNAVAVVDYMEEADVNAVVEAVEPVIVDMPNVDPGPQFVASDEIGVEDLLENLDAEIRSCVQSKMKNGDSRLVMILIAECEDEQASEIVLPDSLELIPDVNVDFNVVPLSVPSNFL